MPQREKAFIRWEEAHEKMLFLVFIRTLFSAIKHIHNVSRAHRHTDAHNLESRKTRGTKTEPSIINVSNSLSAIIQN